MMPSRAQQSGYVGRFAPSPTGDLHFGSLLAAVGSFLQARHHGGKWLIRVEDIDPPREVEGSAQRILSDLRRLGLAPDEPVLLQSTRHEAYAAARDGLLATGLAFHCTCSRGDLPPGGIYPGTCRNGVQGHDGQSSVRIRVGRSKVEFTDRVLGSVAQDLAVEVGDFVIHRVGGLPAYQLAVVVDDAHQGITEVVRGADLLESTPRQIYLQQKLNLPTPSYLHLPLATTPDGVKLSKRLRSDPVNLADPAAALERALSFLGQQPPTHLELAALLAWGIENWNPEAIPRRKSIPLGDRPESGH
jgi:glutamyl-Q tRNA(Asp) synthetase